MSKAKKAYLSQQQIKDEQINFLLGEVKKNLEKYRRALEIKEKQLSDSKKILVSAKQSYNRTVAENKWLKAYIGKLKENFINQQQQQRAQFFEQQKYYYQQKKSNLKKYKEVIYEDESEREPELEQEEDDARQLLTKQPRIIMIPKKKFKKYEISLTWENMMQT